MDPTKNPAPTPVGQPAPTPPAPTVIKPAAAAAPTATQPTAPAPQPTPTPQPTSGDTDVQNYRILAESAKNNQQLTIAQQEQLATLAAKLNLPNPLHPNPAIQDPQSDFLSRAKKDFEQETSDARRKGWIGTILNVIEVLGGAIILAFIINQFVFQPYQVVGVSMVPTLRDNDRLVVSKVAHTWSLITHHKYVPGRYDIIVLKSNLERQFSTAGGDTQLVKRVIGLPGDHVVVKDNHITIYNSDHPDGFNPDENLITKEVLTSGNIDTTIKEGEIFVCGDNRPNSLDSRSKEIGTIPVEHVVGRVRVRMWPAGQAKLF